MNLKIDVQRMGLNLRKSGLGAAYWTRVSWLERHVLSLRPTLGSVPFDDAEKES